MYRGCMYKLPKWFTIALLIILLSSYTGCVNNTEPVNENSILIVGKGSYQSIQSAIEHASIGDTINIPAGTFYETIYINKTINLNGKGTNETLIVFERNIVSVESLIQLNADNCVLSGFTIYSYSNLTRSKGIFIDSKNSTIKNVRVHNFTYGVYLDNAINNLITQDTLTFNDYGLFTTGADSNTFSFNNLSNNKNYGMYLSSSDSNEVSSNLMLYNDYGCRIKGSKANNVEKNVIMNNNKGMYFCCSAKDNYVYDNIFINNTNWNGQDNIGNYWDKDGVGNYWDDYDGPDDNNDNIGDVPYVLSTMDNYSNLDNFPLLIQPFNITYY